MIDSAGQLVHATAVVVGDRGVLICGPSGAGKSSVARALIDRAIARAIFAAVVSDDQCRLQAVSGRLICSVPAALRGGLEVRGSGLHEVDHEAVAVIHLVAELIEADRAVRFADGAEIQLEGVCVPHILLPQREIEAACRAIEARLFYPQWKKR
ncbi:HPr kinase/phosphorylase [Phyllobacterium lublinensis]|jgi:serine kinase of HPr protein (carbohydrate metabolism regulator)|uniref:HPr kinase/phosphorylase n=1 Tax=Phyllobacterium lublinensis TaxID=2875708 RepID=UPI001CCC0F76|nr:HPr kinase/phosphatase C-terminal domain-containing protein [Phyllobacterium sp. 2063]MBZ9656954.1 HPr kinase/phosphatase C-terminal domain-containing protein [Phyllobacterium sp. 2063]